MKAVRKKIKYFKKIQAKYGTRIKYYAYGVAAFYFVMSYVLGTFNPNSYVLAKIDTQKEKEFTDRFVAFTEQPKFSYTDGKGFIKAMHRCIDFLNYSTDKAHRVPHSMIIGMAIIESAYGKSRFAEEGNALFGVRTWDMKQPHMKPLGIPGAQFGVKKYKTKCDSVKDMIRILNEHPAYKDFRSERTLQVASGVWNVDRLMDGVTAWSTNPKYKEIILGKIRAENLVD